MASPNFESLAGATANPVRLVYMMGSIWWLSQKAGNYSLNILEIGSWCGSSALTWGQALELHNGGRGSLTCIDPWEPFSDLEVNPDDFSKNMADALAAGEPFEIFQENIKFIADSVETNILRGWSKDILPTRPLESYDLVYIDGDHCFEGVSSDIALSCPLVKEGGILCGDDLELQSHECDASIARDNPKLDYHFDDLSQSHYHPGVTLAVGEKFGPVSSWNGFWAMQKSGDNWLPVDLTEMPIRIPAHLPAKSLIDLKAMLMEQNLF